MALLEVEKQLALQREKAGTQAPIGSRVGKSTEIVAKKIGLSKNTFERAKKVIEEGPEEVKELCRKQSLSINPAFGIVKAFTDVPDKHKKT